MNKLFRKDLRLCTNAQLIVSVALSALMLIPSFPGAAPFIYAITGIATVFPRLLANRDLEYSMILPIRQKDLVRSKVLFCVFYELLAMVVGAIFAVPRLLVIEPYVASQGGEITSFLSPTIAVFGFGLLGAGIANLILFPIYFRNPFKKMTAPPLLAILAYVVVAAVSTLLSAYVPAFASYDQTGIIVQCSTLCVGAVAFLLITWLSMRISIKRFAKIDL